jgi:hypothetical protein
MKRREALQLILTAGILYPPVSKSALSCGYRFIPGAGNLYACTAGIRSSVATTFAHTQDADMWCWAASISMIFEYYGHPVAQERIVEEAWGSIVDLPADPARITSSLNRDWTDDNDDEFTSTSDSFSVNAITAAQDLAEDHPLIIGALGHATVLTALTYVQNPSAPGGATVTLATVRDPWPGNGGKRNLSPQEWYNVDFAARVRVE